MKIVEVTPQTIRDYGLIELLEDDMLIRDLIMPAALKHIIAYTHRTREELEECEDITLAYVALCVFLYDNRSMIITNDKINTVIASFLDSHCVGLVG